MDWKKTIGSLVFACIILTGITFIVTLIWSGTSSNKDWSFIDFAIGSAKWVYGIGLGITMVIVGISGLDDVLS